MFSLHYSAQNLLQNIFKVGWCGGIICQCKGGKCGSGNIGSRSQGWKMQEWKMREYRYSRGGQCRSRLTVWNAEPILYSDTVLIYFLKIVFRLLSE